MGQKPIPGTVGESPDLSSSCLAVIERAPQPMAVVEGAGHILRCVNPAFCHLIDKTRDQLVGQSFCQMLPEQEDCVVLLDRVLRTGKSESYAEPDHSEPHPVLRSFTVWPVRGNERAVGAIIQVTETAAFHDKTLAMNEALMIGSVRQHELAEAADLSNTRLQKEVGERKGAEAKVRQLNAELEQRVLERTAELRTVNQDLEAFSNSVAHDLRAPLRHVMGFVELLQEEAGKSLSEKSLQHLNTISQSVKRMGDLIDHLLAFAQLGRSDMQTSDVSLDNLVRETLINLQEETKDRNIVWEIHPLPTVRADRALLGLALVNLISNAVKFTGARAEARIEIGRIPQENGETVIFIRDNGAGFDPQYSDKLFGVFQRLHTPSEFEGTGIGLANVQRIIHRHGGRVWAKGAVDGGATFYFSFPKQNGAVNGR
jgi:signal transduction histidine kinase